MPMAKNYTIRAEAEYDYSAVVALIGAAFEDNAQVVSLVKQLRHLTEPKPSISLVAVDENDTPIGHVMISHTWLDAPQGLLDVMVLSPLVVHPSSHGKGIGTELIQAAIQAADAAGSPLLFLEGNHKYYGPRGFENAMALGFRRPSLKIPEKAFQVAKLSNYEKAMTGTFVYRDVHWRHGVGL